MKKIVLGIFIGLLISSGVVYATTLIDSKDITYTPSDSSFEASNVENALNELYNISNYNKCLNPNDESCKAYGMEIIASSVYNSNWAKENAFKDTGLWLTTDLTNGWIGLHYYKKRTIKQVELTQTVADTSDRRCKTFKIQASDDGNTWADLTDVLTLADDNDPHVIDITNVGSYYYYRVYILNPYYSGHYVGLSRVKFIS